MSLNNTPSADRIHIAFFGKRNAGKSSIMNAVTGQNLSIVSEKKGTTTDPVYKAMELLPLGPVMMIDTPGIDDEGDLGRLRVKKCDQVMNKVDFAVLVVDATAGKCPEDERLMEQLKKKRVKYIVAYNKIDLLNRSDHRKEEMGDRQDEIWVSASTGENIALLKEMIGKNALPDESTIPIVADLIHPGDLVILVIPIDQAAPKGRLILPQQQTIREILEVGAVAVVTKETQLEETLKGLAKKPDLVITDSQVFEKVSKQVPEQVLLTSFSILFARHKGEIAIATRGAEALVGLKDGDTVLIAEGCTHHRQCDDIGTVKLPNWITKFTGKKLNFKFTAGTEFPEDLSRYAMIVHCGGCMIHKKEMRYRIQCAKEQGIPITNYGILIAYMNGILKRSLMAIYPLG